MFKILVISATGHTLEVLESPINPIGAGSINTDVAFYIVTETSVDYKSGEIVVHVDEDIDYHD